MANERTHEDQFSPFGDIAATTETVALDDQEQALHIAELEAQITAIGKSQAVILFDMDGAILDANENFLVTLGYTLDEIQGQHHRMFVEEAYGNSVEYRQFWESLNRGEYQSAEYKRLGKGGKEVWIQASYNPILDLNGNPVKVVKYATDVTESKLVSADFQGQISAIGKAQAVISFNMDGTIIDANENFLVTLGYTLDEIQGQHHRMFVEPSYGSSAEYAQFWESLNRGEYQSAEYKRIGKGGKEVWIQASYNPILDLNGNPVKVVKYATEVTAQKLENADFEGQIDAIGKAQAVISFNMDGTIIDANENFLVTLGYTLDEIQGEHHRMFVEDSERNSVEYTQFWEALSRGEYQAAQYKRVGKGGKEVWIQASYNPILDLNGNPVKVVKYATDISAQKVMEAEAREAREREREAATVLQEKVDEMLVVVQASAQGDLTMDVTVSGDDAIGQMGEGLRGFLRGLRDNLRVIRDTGVKVNAASDMLMETSEQMGANAEETSAQADVVSNSAGTVSESLQTIAAAVEQMTASIGEISSNTSKASRMAADAVEKTDRANKIIAKLGESTSEVGDVVKLITSIAEQTNLLALNATIEAARAGEVGRGFAVVANEVKDLAKETARSTDVISEKIENIQADTTEATEATLSVNALIQEINDVQAIIATAVEEQTATTSEMSESITRAAAGGIEISENITGVAQAAHDTAHDTAQGASGAQSAASELSSLAQQQQELVSRFQLEDESAPAGGEAMQRLAEMLQAGGGSSDMAAELLRLLQSNGS